MPNRITSAVPAIIRNLILLFVVRFLVTLALTDFLKEQLGKGTPISLQRIAKVARHLAREVFDVLMGLKGNSIRKLIKKLMLYKRDFERRSNPNRKTTIEKLEDQLSTA